MSDERVTVRIDVDVDNAWRILAGLKRELAEIDSARPDPDDVDADRYRWGHP
jgi:hypothetical protein